MNNRKFAAHFLAVGAVYDRAFVPLDCENCAVIDRAFYVALLVNPEFLVCVVLFCSSKFPPDLGAG